MEARDESHETGYRPAGHRRLSGCTDDLVEYCFTLAKSVGARAISCEIPLSKTKWLGAFADRHKMMVGYHGHTDITNPSLAQEGKVADPGDHRVRVPDSARL